MPFPAEHMGSSRAGFPSLSALVRHGGCFQPCHCVNILAIIFLESEGDPGLPARKPLYRRDPLYGGARLLLLRGIASTRLLFLCTLEKPDIAVVVSLEECDAQTCYFLSKTNSRFFSLGGGGRFR